MSTSQSGGLDAPQHAEKGKGIAAEAQILSVLRWAYGRIPV